MLRNEFNYAFLSEKAEKKRHAIVLNELSEVEKLKFASRNGADDKEWDGWQAYRACDVVSLEESNRLRQDGSTVIVPLRWLRVFKGTVAKSRIVAQGFRDPMLGQYRRDAPTASRLAEAMCLFLIVSFQFEAFLGDIKQAFFQGKKFDRKLYLEQPKGGLRGLMKGQLLRALAGIYGFSEASRMFWMAFKECMIASGWRM